MSDTYDARVLDIPGEGIRLEPAEGSAVPGKPNDVNLLGMAVALALGASGYEHHPEPRDPELQTLDALLAGEATMPWRARAAEQARAAGAVPHVVCERTANGAFRCEVRHRPAERP
jgi:hypothetical protein